MLLQKPSRRARRTRHGCVGHPPSRHALLRKRPPYGFALVLLAATLLGACDNSEGFCVTCGVKEGEVRDGDNDSGLLLLDGRVLDPGDAAKNDAGADSGGGADASTGGCGTEQCNNRDDDCDNKIDEGFNLEQDPMHCGACNQPCAADNAEATCNAGRCEIGACLDGYVDLDETSGCEYRCPVYPPQEEDCNGTDDDCDMRVDEELRSPPVNLCRRTTGTPCAGTRTVCRTYGELVFWACDYSDEVEFDPSVPNGIAAEESLCDGHDGDCDGEADEPFPVGQSCDDGEHGLCRGKTACDPAADNGAVICSYDHLDGAVPGKAEICNGIDDNCDGLVDNDAPDDMVHVDHSGYDFYIYRHEASRPDATAGNAGMLTHRACGRSAVLPWTFVTFDAAQQACANAGKHLCTTEEWLAACQGASALTYPYSDSYDATRCNGADWGPLTDGDASALQPTGSLEACVSSDGALDMSGNVKEWTAEPNGMPRSLSSGGTPIYLVRGGSYESPELGLSCTTELAQAAAFPGQTALGFRCCATTDD